MKKAFIFLFVLMLTYSACLSNKEQTPKTNVNSSVKCAEYSNEPLLEYSVLNSNNLKNNFTNDYLKTDLCVMNQGVYYDNYLPTN